MQIEAWGAGGGGGLGAADCDTGPYYEGGAGGAGAYSLGLLHVTPGQTNRVVVGLGGSAGASATDGEDTVFADMAGNPLLFAGGGKAGTSATGSANGAGGAGGLADPNAVIKRFGSAGSLSGGGSGAPGLANAACFKVVTGGHGYWDSVGRGGYGGGPSPCSDVAEAGAQGYMLVRW